MGKFPSTLIACTVLAVASTASAQQLVYRNTFRNGGDSRWSHPSASKTPSGRFFLGPFTKEPVVFSLTDLPAHTQVTVAFNMFAIGGWTGSDVKGGPDIWEFGEAGAARQLYSTFATSGKTQSYPAPYPQGSFLRGSWAFESNTLGYSTDSVFHIQRTFTHSASDLLLEFRSSGERWGLDNVEVWVTPTGLAANAWGYGALYGQVGNDLVERQPVPRGVGGVKDVIALAGGHYHSLALSADGSIWGWGDNRVGQTVTADGPIPRRINGPSGEELPRFSAMASGPYTALALGPAGTLWTWGANESGQAGLGFTSSFTRPTQIPKTDSFVAVAAGYQHSVALRADGSVWAWGRNDYGQLGLGFTGPPVSTPKLVGGLRNLGANIVAIAAGEQHVLAIDSRGSVWGWGYNGSRQLGGSALFVASPRQFASGALSVAGGQSHTLVLLEDGRVSAGGDNQAGQLGTGLGSRYGYVQNATGGDFTGVVAIGASGLQSFAITNGEVWGFGRNDYGQLGTGRCTAEDPLPVLVRGSAGMIAVAGGSWHSLGVGPAPAASDAPSEVDFGERVIGSSKFKANVGKVDSNVATVSIGVVAGAAVTFSGAGVNPATRTILSGEATFSFDPSTMYLTVELTNTSMDDVRAASDVLTAVFFRINNNPSFTPGSAMIPAGTVVFFGPDGGRNVGGEWAYAGGISGPNLASKGISTAAFGIFGNANLRGLNLEGTVQVENHNYGITSAGDNPGTGDAAVRGAEPLIKNSVRFRVKSAVILDPKTALSNVSFQYGTSTNDPNLPGR